MSLKWPPLWQQPLFPEVPDQWEWTDTGENCRIWAPSPKPPVSPGDTVFSLGKHVMPHLLAARSCQSDYGSRDAPVPDAEGVGLQLYPPGQQLRLAGLQPGSRHFPAACPHRHLQRKRTGENEWTDDQPNRIVALPQAVFFCNERCWHRSSRRRSTPHWPGCLPVLLGSSHYFQDAIKAFCSGVDAPHRISSLMFDNRPAGIS